MKFNRASGKCCVQPSFKNLYKYKTEEMQSKKNSCSKGLGILVDSKLISLRETAAKMASKILEGINRGVTFRIKGEQGYHTSPGRLHLQYCIPFSSVGFQGRINKITQDLKVMPCELKGLGNVHFGEQKAVQFQCLKYEGGSHFSVSLYKIELRLISR